MLVAAFAFTAILQFLSAALGTAGKFAAIVLLMLQLTSSGGTFPMQTVPRFFQIINPWLPMTYVVSGLRQAISGGDLRALALDAAVLLGFAALARVCDYTDRAPQADLDDGPPQAHHHDVVTASRRRGIVLDGGAASSVTTSQRRHDDAVTVRRSTTEAKGRTTMPQARSGTLDRLFTAAIELFGERGYAGATVDDIVERAGVAKGTVYYHFRSKSELVSALLDDGLRRLAASFRSEIEGAQGGAAALRALVHAELVYIERYQAFSKLVMSEMWRADRDWRDNLRTLREEYVAVFAGVLAARRGDRRVPRRPRRAEHRLDPVRHDRHRGARLAGVRSCRRASTTSRLASRRSSWAPSKPRMAPASAPLELDQLHEQRVAPGAVGYALVGAHDADRGESRGARRRGWRARWRPPDRP